MAVLVMIVLHADILAADIRRKLQRFGTGGTGGGIGGGTGGIGGGTGGTGGGIGGGTGGIGGGTGVRNRSLIFQPAPNDRNTFGGARIRRKS
jgi:hypothetical protein